jgi:hypothetical protein
MQECLIILCERKKMNVRGDANLASTLNTGLRVAVASNLDRSDQENIAVSLPFKVEAQCLNMLR